MPRNDVIIELTPGRPSKSRETTEEADKQFMIVPLFAQADKVSSLLFEESEKQLNRHSTRISCHSDFKINTMKTMKEKSPSTGRQYITSFPSHCETLFCSVQNTITNVNNEN